MRRDRRGWRYQPRLPRACPPASRAAAGCYREKKEEEEAKEIERLMSISTNVEL